MQHLPFGRLGYSDRLRVRTSQHPPRNGNGPRARIGDQRHIPAVAQDVETLAANGPSLAGGAAFQRSPDGLPRSAIVVLTRQPRGTVAVRHVTCTVVRVVPRMPPWRRTACLLPLLAIGCHAAPKPVETAPCAGAPPPATINDGDSVMIELAFNWV